MEKKGDIGFSRILIFCLLLTISTIVFISAFSELQTIDKIKVYDELSKEITIKNDSIKQEEIAKVKLNTPQIFKVLDRGEGIFQKVVEYEINNLGGDYANAFEKIEFFDIIRNNKSINKEFKIKYKIKNGQKLVREYRKVCIENKDIQLGESPRSCPTTQIGSHFEDTFTWIDIENSKLQKLPLGNITIGIFTDVREGEFIEHIPTFFDTRMPEFSSWVSSFNNGLELYLTFNESSGNLIDTGPFAHYNLTGGAGIQRGESGLIGSAVNFSSDGEALVSSNGIKNLSGSTTGAFSIWINPNAFLAENGFVIQYGRAGTTQYIALKVDNSGGGELSAILVDAGTKWEITTNISGVADILTTTDEWQHFVISHDASNVSFYWNGTKQDRMIDSTDVSYWVSNLSSQPNRIQLGQFSSQTGNNYAGGMDELAIWVNETKTQSEVIDLYNTGLGITRQDSSDVFLSVTHPSNLSVFNNSHSVLNYSIQSGGTLDSCWNSVDEGVTNSSLVTPGTNFTGLVSATTGEDIWIVYCNGTTIGTEVFDTTTFTINDTIIPNITIINVTTTLGSQTATFNFTINETNPDTCIYRVDTPEGVEDIANTTLDSCFENDTQMVVSAFGDFNLTIYINDSGFNSRTNQTQFTLTDTPPISGGSSGGGGSSPAKIPVIGLNEIETTYSKLEREIIYSTINSLCSEKQGETLAIADFSETCSLTTNDLPIVQQRLTEFDVVIDEDNLRLFFEKYKDGDFFQGFETEDTIIKFNLFTQVLGITNPLMLNPPSVDTPFLINVEEENTTIPFIITSNKPLKTCEIISDSLEFSCEVTETSVKVILNIQNTSFFTNNYIGKMVVTTDAERAKIEQRTVSLVFRVINRKHIPPFLIVLFVVVIVVIFLVFNKKSRTKILKTFKK